ncbi:MAG: succinate dehydrogenase cytochrome b subunit, partial [Planctomycetaceae bacterium]|nr:succinate dehydrogenase cytochrome b subunit [Planctomycetaceae bacterium]
AESYNHYAHSLHANPALIAIAEIVLYSAFLAHIYLAIVTNKENHDARGQDYAVKQTKRTNRNVNIFGWTPDTTMFVTGAVVLAFILVHMNDFSWGLVGADDVEREPYDKAVFLMGNMVRGVVYLIGCLFLGIHVAHGMQSAFQSLGLNHPQFTPLVRKASIAFAFVVTVGFGSFVLWGWSQAAQTGAAATSEVAPAAPEGELPAEHVHPHPHPHPEPDQK